MSFRLIQPRRITGVIVDLAGTIADYGCQAPTRAFLETFKKAHINISSFQIRQFMGLHKREHLIRLLALPEVKEQWNYLYSRDPSSSGVEELYQDFVPRQLRIIPEESKLIPGAKEVLKQLQDQGIRIGATTGYTREMAELLNKSLINQGVVLDSLVASDDVAEGRPAPDMIHRNMERLGLINPEEVIKVGDTEDDIREGRSAGVWTVGVVESSSLIGLREEEFKALSAHDRVKTVNDATHKLRLAQPSYVIPSIKDLLDVVKVINVRLGKGERPS